ncbi:MAG: 2-oxo acid dehydrogenase subunit E2 [Bradymonadales bacterium]|nr:2-oxo acid dehydrogenase subunit E2 [Bradymonadales bacterium]
MVVALVVIGVILALWILINLRTSRPDGVHIKKVHPYRKLIPYVMRGRNEAVVYFDASPDAEKLLEYLERARKLFDVDLTHCVVAACAIGLFENPAMNRYIMGRRYYQRKGSFISFSMKRKRMDKKAKLSIVKMEMQPEETFREFCQRVNDKIDVERSGRRTYSDKEYDLFGLIPRPVLNGAVRLLRWLDYHGLLPGSFISSDGMYTSIFVANLGSLQMAAGYHHLYEWGNCSLFLMVGQVEERPVVVDGQVTVKKVLPLRFSYDERIEDGLTARFGIESAVRVIENPFEWLGCLAEDGSDARPLGSGAKPEAAS